MQTTKEARRPWGLIAATLMGSMVTLIGVIRGIDPSMVLQRVAVAASVTGIVVMFAVKALVALSPSRSYPGSKGGA